MHAYRILLPSETDDSRFNSRVKHMLTDSVQPYKPVTDEQVFYDKFLCDKFYLPSARVYMQQILYDKFSCDKFYLPVWTCQKKVYIAAMTEKL
jgi:hypothetical protein